MHVLAVVVQINLVNHNAPRSIAHVLMAVDARVPRLHRVQVVRVCPADPIAPVVHPIVPEVARHPRVLHHQRLTAPMAATIRTDRIVLRAAKIPVDRIVQAVVHRLPIRVIATRRHQPLAEATAIHRSLITAVIIRLHPIATLPHPITVVTTVTAHVPPVVLRVSAIPLRHQGLM